MDAKQLTDNLKDLVASMTKEQKNDSAAIICAPSQIDRLCELRHLSYKQIGGDKDAMVYLLTGLSEHPEALDGLRTLGHYANEQVHSLNADDLSRMFEATAKQMQIDDYDRAIVASQKREQHNWQREQNKLRQRYHNKHPYRK